MRRKTIATGIMSLVVLVVALVVFPVGQSAAIEDANFEFVERPTGITPIDLGPAGPSAGDQLVLENPLFDATNTTQIGTLSGVCVQTGASPTAYYCTATMELADGQITVDGATDLAEPTGFIAVTGGTGAYSKARGEVFVDQSNPTAIQLSVDL